MHNLFFGENKVKDSHSYLDSSFNFVSNIGDAKYLVILVYTVEYLV